MEIGSQPVTSIKKEDTPETSAIPSYLVDLNDQQLAAAIAPVEGATRILGSPAERSVEVLVARITHLVRHHGLEPSQIVVLTFSKEGTSDILKRLREVSNLGWNTANELVIGSFHQICRRYLVEYSSHVSLRSDFEVRKPYETSKIVEGRPCYRVASHKVRLRAVNFIEAISYVKNKGLSPDRLRDEKLERYNSSERSVIADVWPAYEEKLELHNILDYDNLLIKGAELFALPLFAESFATVLVDSFHNTTALEYKVAKALATHSQSITIVGSPDLSIFDWKSANDGQFEELIEDFGTHRTMKLEQNYTTSQSIVAFGNKLIKQDKSRISKTLFSQAPRGLPVVLHHAADETEEARFIARTIDSLREQLDGIVDYQDFAVLVKLNYMLKPIEAALREAEIPFSDEVGSNAVMVSTIHSAASLSLAVVFIPGVEKGIFPHSSAMNYDEERRILFVAMSSSRTHCVLSYAETREGSTGRSSSKSLSPFIYPISRLSRLPAITDSMRRDVATVLGKEWRPRPDEVEEEKVKVEDEKAVPAQSPLHPQAIPTTPKHERETNRPSTPQRKRVKRAVEDSPTPRS